MDIQFDIKIKYNTILGKLFSWILKGPIEGHSFEVIAELNTKDVLDDPRHFINAQIGLFETDTADSFVTEKEENVKFINNKYLFSLKQKLFTGKYDIRLFLFSNFPLKLFDKEGFEYKNKYEVAKDDRVPFGAQYYSEILTVHPFTNVILLIFAFLSGLGAIFEILGYFKSAPLNGA